MTSLAQMLQQNPYLAYTYAYPHKTAYRALDPPLPLADLWREEKRDTLFLYVHVPFCEVRCGYCNLFTLAQSSQEPGTRFQTAYLDAVQRQARSVRAAIGAACFARMAIGGGTPTCLDLGGLCRLFDVATEVLGADPAAIPLSVETSPRTATLDKLRLLRERGADRISIGVQSFVEAEVSAAGRVQQAGEVEQALDRIRQVGFDILNVDLIYGLPGQTVESWQDSLQAALRFAPEELYLYPLYVRPLTGLARRDRAEHDVRLACYRAGRDLLLDAGYEQVSMRLFRAGHAALQDGPAYSCQEDGMVGLGCGARSYTRGCHYSSEYAVGRAGIRAILEQYIARPGETFALAHHGFVLDAEDQHRRYVIKSLLRVQGLALGEFRRFFGAHAFDCVPELAELAPRGLATHESACLRLTAAGLEWSDTIGPWLYSARVRELLETYKLR